MSLTLDPEIAAALAPMAESDSAPPAVGDIAGRSAILSIEKWVSRHRCGHGESPR